MTDDELFILETNMPRLRAVAMLEDARAGKTPPLTAQGWYDLTLAAGGTRDEAEAAHNAVIRAQWRAGQDAR